MSAVSYTVYMFYYYWTSAGGPVVLAMTMVPLTFGLFTLRALRDDEFYPKLPRNLNYVIALAILPVLDLLLLLHEHQLPGARRGT